MRVSPGRISQILSGDKNITLKTLNAVVEALGAQAEFRLLPQAEQTPAATTAGPAAPRPVGGLLPSERRQYLLTTSFGSTVC
jgi:transcriptional regulator with XRE-family HTH domain